MKQKVLIFTATYNEVANISSLIKQILSLHLNANLLVVDDDLQMGLGFFLKKLLQKTVELMSCTEMQSLV